MDLKKDQGMDLSEFHRCDAPLVDEQGMTGQETQAEPTGLCEPTISDPNQWNQWAQRISAGALNSKKPD